MMLTLAGFALLTSIFYSPQLADTRPRMPAVEAYLPMIIWSLAWLITAIILAGSAITGRGKPLAVGEATAMPCLWAAVYLGAWIIGDAPGGYITATTFILIAVLSTARFALIQEGRPHAG